MDFWKTRNRNFETARVLRCLQQLQPSPDSCVNGPFFNRISPFNRNSLFNISSALHVDNRESEKKSELGGGGWSGRGKVLPPESWVVASKSRHVISPRSFLPTSTAPRETNLAREKSHAPYSHIFCFPYVMMFSLLLLLFQSWWIKRFLICIHSCLLSSRCQLLRLYLRRPTGLFCSELCFMFLP